MNPLSRNANRARESLHMLSVNMCVSVFACALQICTLAKNGNFVCLWGCAHCQWKRSAGACMCVSHWYSIALGNLWPNRSHHVWVRLHFPQALCMLMLLSASLDGMLHPLHGLDLRPAFPTSWFFFLLLLFLCLEVTIPNWNCCCVLQWF